MEMADLIKPDRVIASLRASNKVQVVNELSRRAAKMLGLDVQCIVDALMRREALGSTGIGQGIAIPHARIDGVQPMFGLFARLRPAIEFAAVDDRPVDLVFLLLIPSDAGNEHLAALACVSRQLRDREIARDLRSIQNGQNLFERLTR